MGKSEQIISLDVYIAAPKNPGMKIEPGVLLQKIDSPEDLKKLGKEELYKVCDELR